MTWREPEGDGWDGASDGFDGLESRNWPLDRFGEAC
jgi:hypothetical protein